jgi:FtsP/CotA-like multicopper oxidase with cupredoxin domain
MSTTRISRREFIRLASVGAAGAYLGAAGVAEAQQHGPGPGPGGGGGGGDGFGTGGTTVTPSVGAPLKDPVELPLTLRPDGAKAGMIEPMVSSVPIGGQLADVLTYNGSYPGPVVRLKKGDQFAMRFKNSLPMLGTNILGYDRSVTNIHTHGWHVSPSGMMDDVHRHFMPGEEGDYLYDLSLQAPGTLAWYHAHIHGVTAEQTWGGLHGPLVIEDETTLLSGYETHILVLKDITISGGVPAPYTSQMEFMQGKEGDTVMVNGQVNPVLTMRPGQVQRWRILNASNARFYKIQLQSHSLQVIGTDDGLLDKRYPQSYVVLSPGERLDVLVKASTTAGVYQFLALPYSRRGNMTTAQVTLMTVNVTGTRRSDALPSVIDPAAKRVVTDLSKWPHRTFSLTMRQGRGYINGQDFDVNPYTVNSPVMPGMTMYEVWTITSDMGMDHPWHQHTNPAQVLSISGGDAAYRTLYTQSPAWKDVVNVPKWGSATLLVKVADWMGMAMFHCHIVEHEDVGMMGIWNLGDMGPMPH